MKKNRIHTSLFCDKETWEEFKSLCENNNTNVTFALTLALNRLIEEMRSGEFNFK